MPAAALPPGPAMPPAPLAAHAAVAAPWSSARALPPDACVPGSGGLSPLGATSTCTVAQRCDTRTRSRPPSRVADPGCRAKGSDHPPPPAPSAVPSRGLPASPASPIACGRGTIWRAPGIGAFAPPGNGRREAARSRSTGGGGAGSGSRAVSCSTSASSSSSSKPSSKPSLAVASAAAPPPPGAPWPPARPRGSSHSRAPAGSTVKSCAGAAA